MKSGSTFRIRFISFFIFLFSLFLITRLFYLQIVRGGTYSESADRQYMSPTTQLYNRGSIYFTLKTGTYVSAAGLGQSYILTLNPAKLKDATIAYTKISGLVGSLNQTEFLAKATKKNDTYEVAATKLDTATADKVAALKLTGVSVFKEKWRSYPAGPLAAHVIGFTGYLGNDYAGRYGVEKYYDNVLARKGSENFVNFFAEIFAGLGSSLGANKKTQSQEGDIILTIEPKAQSFLESELADVMKRYSPDRAGGIIMDPKTGEIFAMAALPNFNPADKKKDIAILSNPMVESVYEMGSIIKPLTMAAGIDLGAVTAKTTYDDTGYVILNKAKIQNYDHRARGVIPMQEVLNQSLNTGVTFVEQKIGQDNFRRYFKNYGLGEKTGIDLPNEVSGKLKNLDGNIDINFATASFGQGISLTPIATVRALSSLANGGYLVRPHVVKKIRYKTLIEEAIKPEIGRQVISKETSQKITEMLITVVDKALKHGTVSMPHFSIAAKTGTAQIAKPGGGGYEEGTYLHSFFGYFPARNPRFIVFLFTIHPKGVTYAEGTLTDPFMNIAKLLINYYEIPPDR